MRQCTDAPGQSARRARPPQPVGLATRPLATNARPLLRPGSPSMVRKASHWAATLAGLAASASASGKLAASAGMPRGIHRPIYREAADPEDGRDGRADDDPDWYEGEGEGADEDDDGDEGEGEGEDEDEDGDEDEGEDEEGDGDGAGDKGADEDDDNGH